MVGNNTSSDKGKVAYILSILDPTLVGALCIVIMMMMRLEINQIKRSIWVNVLDGFNCSCWIRSNSRCNGVCILVK